MKTKIKLSHMQIIALGYAIMILVGTLLLMLPISVNGDNSASFLDSIFTATSASCVTGLIVHDTCVYWSFFGQIVIITLIQIGGLGFMTIATFFLMIMRRRIGLREREVMVESINYSQVGGIVRLTKKIIAGTVFFEGLGALLLSIRFIPNFGLLRGIYYSVFHSISAFCNAGFDLMGIREQYSSFTAYTGDWIVNSTIMMLIIVGGIGFFVWQDVWKNKFRIKRYALHTKIVLSVTLILIFGGAILFYLFEQNNLGKTMTTSENIWASLFDSVTARTAGFNSTDTGSLTDASKMLTIVLMFIGGSPGSTAGGIKTTTLAVIMVYALSGITRQQGANVFGRRLSDDALKKSVYVFTWNLTLAVVGGITICAIQNISLTDVLFEVFSAIGTVGMTTGITRSLCGFSKIIIVFLMYCGRVGSVSFALAMLERKAKPMVTQPVEEITVG